MTRMLAAAAAAANLALSAGCAAGAPGSAAEPGPTSTSAPGATNPSDAAGPAAADGQSGAQPAGSGPDAAPLPDCATLAGVLAEEVAYDIELRVGPGDQPSGQIPAAPEVTPERHRTYCEFAGASVGKPELELSLTVSVERPRVDPHGGYPLDQWFPMTAESLASANCGDAVAWPDLPDGFRCSRADPGVANAAGYLAGSHAGALVHAQAELIPFDQGEVVLPLDPTPIADQAAARAVELVSGAL